MTHGANYDKLPCKIAAEVGQLFRLIVSILITNTTMALRVKMKGKCRQILATSRVYHNT